MGEGAHPCKPSVRVYLHSNSKNIRPSKLSKFRRRVALKFTKIYHSSPPGLHLLVSTSIWEDEAISCIPVCFTTIKTLRVVVGCPCFPLFISVKLQLI